MKKFKFTLLAFMAAMMAISFTACSDDDPTLVNVSFTFGRILSVIP